MMSTTDGKTITIRFTDEELSWYRQLLEHFNERKGVDVSRHKWLKMAMDKGAKLYAVELQQAQEDGYV